MKFPFGPSRLPPNRLFKPPAFLRSPTVLKICSRIGHFVLKHQRFMTIGLILLMVATASFGFSLMYIAAGPFSPAGFTFVIVMFVIMKIINLNICRELDAILYYLHHKESYTAILFNIPIIAGTFLNILLETSGNAVLAWLIKNSILLIVFTAAVIYALRYCLDLCTENPPL